MYEQARVLSVNSHKEVRWLTIQKPDLASAFQELSNALKEHKLPIPQMLDSEKRGSGWALLVTAPTETLTAIGHLAERTSSLSLDSEELSTITATCQGAFASPIPEEIAQALSRRNVPIRKMHFSAMSITVLLDAKDREKASQIIHDLRLSPITG